jgi:hypothetical protein
VHSVPILIQFNPPDISKAYAQNVGETSVKVTREKEQYICVSYGNRMAQNYVWWHYSAFVGKIGGGGGACKLVHRHLCLCT